jgi:hypothetical protein
MRSFPDVALHLPGILVSSARVISGVFTYATGRPIPTVGNRQLMTALYIRTQYSKKVIKFIKAILEEISSEMNPGFPHKGIVSRETLFIFTGN